VKHEIKSGVQYQTETFVLVNKCISLPTYPILIMKSMGENRKRDFWNQIV